MILALLLLLATPAPAATNAEVEETVKTFLTERHPTEGPAWWKGLGANAPGVIMKLYKEDSNLFHRGKLLQGLGNFDGPEVADFLKQEALKTENDSLRAYAVRSVGASRGAAEEEFISKFLAHADPDTRIAAAEMLKKLGDPKGRLEKFYGDEKLAWVVSRVKALALPPAHGGVKVVASSEDRLSADLTGTWRGYWVEPKPDSAAGMRSEAVILRLTVEGATVLKGDLSLKEKGRVRTFAVAGEGKASRFSATFTEQLGASDRAKGRVAEVVPADASLGLQAGALVLELKAPKAAALVWLRRDPAKLPP